jgi:hypothetical protein
MLEPLGIFHSKRWDQWCYPGIFQASMISFIDWFGVYRLSGVPESPHFPIQVDKWMPSFKGNLGTLGSLAWEYVHHPVNN